MSTDSAVDHDTVPPANKGLLAVAAVLLAIPIIALLWVSSYAKAEPKLGGFPFFIWYQFLWVFICSALTYTAYRLVLKARPHRPMSGTTGATGTDRIDDRLDGRTERTDRLEGGRDRLDGRTERTDRLDGGRDGRDDLEGGR